MIYVVTVLSNWTVETEGKPQNVSIGISGNVIEQYSVYVYGMTIVPVHCMESYGEYGRIAPRFLNFGSRWSRMVN